MLSILTETQKAIVETITMKLSVVEALSYLKDVGFKMSRAKYFRQKRKVENMKLERMQHIAMYFQDQHLDRIDKCELIEKLMWENYRTGDIKRVNILNSIMNMQSWLSAYYDATRYVLEKKVKTYTDFMKTPRTYVSIDVLEKRKKEVEQEQFDFYHKRQLETIAENNKPIVIEKIPAIGDEEPLDHQDQVILLPKPNTSTNIEQPSSQVNNTPIEEQQEEESEADKYWRTHPSRVRPNHKNSVTYSIRSDTNA
jgi:hypothetical protein